MSKYTAFDVETTGVDLFHGARPFFVSACDQDGSQVWWEWDVDPLTREVQIPKGDLKEIQELLDSSQEIVCHNGKFDATAVQQIGLRFPWEKAQDTLIASHLLSSNTPHDLTNLGIEYLDISIKEHEEKLGEVVKKCRNYVRTNHKNWQITEGATTKSPSATKETWRHDYWLPRAVATHNLEYDKTDRDTLLTVLRDYANPDTWLTAQLWPLFRELLKKRGVWEIYRTRMKLYPIAQKMERRGLSVNKKKAVVMIDDYSDRSKESGNACKTIAERYSYDLELPKSGASKSLTKFVFDTMGVKPVKLTEKNATPSLDAESRREIESTLGRDEEGRSGNPYKFFKYLNTKTNCDKAVAALEGYRRFWRGTDDPDWCVLHPGTNPTGTDTLRWSFSNPNQANISKREGFNLRYCFGPRPGRVWYSADAQNIELRIPAFEAGEKELMDVFNRPFDPPYYGSYHLFVFDVLHPKLFSQWGKECKTIFESTWYQWVKNGNFAVIYGAQETKADATYRVEGAYKLLQKRFPKIAELNQRMMSYARKWGWVETIPDKTVNPRRGYPLICGRSERGIVPTTPLNYHVSGTAMWWMGKGMVRCDGQLTAWFEEDGFDGYIAAQVHDELLFDFPQEGEADGGNVERTKELKRLMELGGEDIGIPTPTAWERHPETWAVGIAV